MRILGIEGTAWAASAAIYDTRDETIVIESNPYQPDSGGLHPREAAEHMSTALPEVISIILDRAATSGETDTIGIDAVAFSRGPGLGPCLRVVGTAARTLTQALSVPLVGVNHMIAHLEIGRYQSGFETPVCLNASGANAHLLGYHRSQYQVLGETMDTGVGNAIDKFTRHLEWDHPGGPKVEAAATDGDYYDLPYVVKGMDFSFSGIMSAAKDAVDDGAPVEDVCTGLQETIFAMLTEVTERALSLTGTSELVLGGGVGQNDRLREMLSMMCAARGASFHAPEPRFLRDNAGMIAVLGAAMHEAGQTISVENSAVDPNFRPDAVTVKWRDNQTSVTHTPTTLSESPIRGAEATVRRVDDRVIKRRVEKSYRHPKLDRQLRAERTRAEARLTSAARRLGVPTPVIYDVDPMTGTLIFDYVGDADLAAELTESRCRAVGQHLGKIHDAGFVHGDPTTRNIRVDPAQTYMIDFGLGYHTDHIEDHAMDLHVFIQSITGTASDPNPLITAFESGYAETGMSTVQSRLGEIESRGRYQ
jgi:O-sialoglycoprotein endopeptidase (EC 3.4.24.57)